MTTGPWAVRFQHPELPSLQDVAQYFRASEDAAWFSNGGPCNEQLTKRIELEVLGTHATLTSSGTSALAVALQATGLRKRDDIRTLVAIPSFTFAAVASVVLWAGLEPVFVDVEPTSWHMSPEHLANTLRLDGPQRFAAVIAASTFGMPPHETITDQWEHICRKHGIPLIVDSAAGFGSQRSDGSSLGSQGDIEAFSFHVTKPFGVGEGGLLSTRDDALDRRIKSLVNFGFDTDRTVVEQIGTNAKMSEVQAATGLCVLDAFATTLTRRRSAALRARNALVAGGWSVQAHSDNASWQFIPALAPDQYERDQATKRCAAAGIEVRHYFKPLHRHPALERIRRPAGLQTTEWLAERSLSLPLSTMMDPEVAAWIGRVAVGRDTGVLRTIS